MSGLSHQELLPGVIHIRDALGVYMTLLLGSKSALLIDAGYGLQNVRAYAESLAKGRPVSLLLTHAHHDHALGAGWFDACLLDEDELSVYGTYVTRERRLDALRAALGAEVVIDQEAYLALPDPELVSISRDAIDLGGLTAVLIQCPGHTPGSRMVYVPERELLLTGDNWNPCTWLFFPEALTLREWKENILKAMALPFTRVICPHREGLYPRRALEDFLSGLDSAVQSAKEVDTGRAMGIRTFEAAWPDGQTLVFDREKNQSTHVPPEIVTTQPLAE